MSYQVYILYSAGRDIYYKGQTRDLAERLKRHNSGSEKSTRGGIPWQLVWSTEKPDRVTAMRLERKLKNYDRERTKEFIEKWGVVAGPDDAARRVGVSGC
jgi:putative endonuclease